MGVGNNVPNVTAAIDLLRAYYCSGTKLVRSFRAEIVQTFYVVRPVYVHASNTVVTDVRYFVTYDGARRTVPNDKSCDRHDRNGCEGGVIPANLTTRKTIVPTVYV